MTDLCNLVKENGAALFDMLNAGPSDVSAIDSDECIIESPKVVVSIQIDRRDNEVSSRVVPRSAIPEFDDLCDTRLLSKFFPSIMFYEHEIRSSLVDSLKREVNNIISVLDQVMKLDERQQRDMFYFVRGYTHGYTSHFT